MAKLLLALVLALFVATIEATPDAACGNTGNAACAGTETCENNKCKIKAGGTCSGVETTCIGGAACASSTCTCPSPSTASTDNTKCEVALNGVCSTVLFCATGLTCKDGTCKTIITGTCNPSTPATCVSGVCTGTACACPAGQSALTGNTGCSGASFVAASFLSMVAMFVTTRLL